MDGAAFSQKRRPDKHLQDAMHQYAKGVWNDRLKEKDRYLKIAWSCCGGMGVLAAMAISGSIYLGTLPKKDVQTVTLDPLGYSMKLYGNDLLTASERTAWKRVLVENFVKNLREVHPYSKKKQERALLAAVAMVKPGTIAARKGREFFKETAPYERMKKEAVDIEITASNPSADGFHIEFTETVRSLSTMYPRETQYVGFVATEQSDDFESKKARPLGLAVVDYSFDAKGGER